jgi:ArsR family transcriptional regulator, arsenate/arsenite/antimonite-responsive transcriptional repressor
MRLIRWRDLLTAWRLTTFPYLWKYNKMNNKLIVSQLASIAQEARLEIFRLLVQAGPEGLAAGSIGETLSIPPSTLSFHLKELSHAGLVHSEQVSRFIYYSANYEAMESLIGYLTENCCAGEKRCCPDALRENK